MSGRRVSFFHRLVVLPLPAPSGFRPSPEYLCWMTRVFRMAEGDASVQGVPRCATACNQQLAHHRHQCHLPRLPPTSQLPPGCCPAVLLHSLLPGTTPSHRPSPSLDPISPLPSAVPRPRRQSHPLPCLPLAPVPAIQPPASPPSVGPLLAHSGFRLFRQGPTDSTMPSWDSLAIRFIGQILYVNLRYSLVPLGTRLVQPIQFLHLLAHQLEFPYFLPFRPFFYLPFFPFAEYAVPSAPPRPRPSSPLSPTPCESPHLVRVHPSPPYPFICQPMSHLQLIPARRLASFTPWRP